MALNPTLIFGWSGNFAYGNKWGGKTASAGKISLAYKSPPALRQLVVADFTKRLQSQSLKGA